MKHFEFTVRPIERQAAESRRAPDCLTIIAAPSFGASLQVLEMF